jgi:hypothetical protein
METPDWAVHVKLAVLTVAEIKAATEAFDRGDANVFAVLDAIVVAVEAYRSAAPRRREAA